MYYQYVVFLHYAKTLKLDMCFNANSIHEKCSMLTKIAKKEKMKYNYKKVLTKHMMT